MLLENLSRGILGMFFLVVTCWLLSNNKKAISWKLVGMGIFGQIMFAVGVLNTKIYGQPVFWILFGAILLYTIFNKFRRAKKNSAGLNANAATWGLSAAWQLFFFFGIILSAKWSNMSVSIIISIILIAFCAKWLNDRKAVEFIKWNILTSLLVTSVAVYTKTCNPDIFRVILQGCSDGFVQLINISHKGTDFLFQPLSYDKAPWGYVFAIQVLPNIIFFAALSSILYFLGILQKIVYVFAYLLNKMNISGAESLSTSANIFLGQTEAPLMIRPYLEKMTRSEIMCIMVGGFANTAGSVMAAYVGMLGGNDPAQQSFFALHMLSQSIMSAPAAIVVSKIIFPQTEHHLVSKELVIPKEKLGDNFLDALSIGTTDGLKLAVNVGAMLLVFTAVIFVFNAILDLVGDWTNLNKQIPGITNGRYDSLSLQMILGYLFSPVAWLIGVPTVDIVNIGQLLGEKTILNEFYAFKTLNEMRGAHTIQDPKSILIATYALSGFANFASIGIQIGGISQLAPNQRKNLTEMGIKALIGGTIATLMCACIAGALS